MSFREEEMLEKFGCKNIEYNNLVNNYFIKLEYNNIEYRIKHVLNVYGEAVDYWELPNGASFGSLEELLNYIK